jgi:hypothetical protein
LCLRTPFRNDAACHGSDWSLLDLLCFLSSNSAVESLDRNDTTADRSKPDESSNESSPTGPGKASKKHSLNSLTARRVLAGTKNSRPVGFYSRNSTKCTVNPNTTIPQIWPPWWCRLPLIRRGIYGSARSDARNFFRRGRAGGWLKRII